MADIQRGKMTLGDFEFEVDDCENTIFYVTEGEEEDGTIAVSFDVKFKRGKFGSEDVAPEMIINDFETGKEDIEDVIGSEFTVETVDEADEREDTLYIYEHEPFMNYTLKLIDIEDDIIHLTISGTAITDGYSEPEETADFEGEFWLRYKEI